MERHLAAVLSADLVGFSRLVARSEEQTLQRLADQRRQIIDPLLRLHRGRLFKTMGDGLLVEFASAVDAVRYALAHQEQVSHSQADIAAEERLSWRMAIHLGDVVIDGDDLLGDGVNVASRLQAHAPPGGVLVSQTIRDHLPGNFTIKPAGTPQLKNIARQIQVFEVLRDGENTSGPSAARRPFSLLSRRASRAGLAAFAVGLMATGLWFGIEELNFLRQPVRNWLSSEPAQLATSPPRILVMP